MGNLHLATSDWVAVVVGITQLVVSTVLAIWTVRRTALTLKNEPPSVPAPTSRHFLWAWLKSSWIFLLFFIYAFYKVGSLATGSDEVTKSLILKIALYSAYGVLNAVASVGFFVVQIQFEVMDRVAKVLVGMNEVHGKSAKIQGEHLSITKSLLETKSPTRRRRK